MIINCFFYYLRIRFNSKYYGCIYYQRSCSWKPNYMHNHLLLTHYTIYNFKQSYNYL